MGVNKALVVSTTGLGEPTPYWHKQSVAKSAEFKIKSVAKSAEFKIKSIAKSAFFTLVVLKKMYFLNIIIIEIRKWWLRCLKERQQKN